MRELFWLNWCSFAEVIAKINRVSAFLDQPVVFASSTETGCRVTQVSVVCCSTQLHGCHFRLFAKCFAHLLHAAESQS